MNEYLHFSLLSQFKRYKLKKTKKMHRAENIRGRIKRYHLQ